jgi:hypothetical protein
MNIECRRTVFYFIYLKKQSEATSTIRQSSTVNCHFMKFHMRVWRLILALSVRE